MTSQLPSVNLLILTSRAEEAAELITTLRNGGIPARGIYTDQCQRLVELTTTGDPVDLILCCAHDPAISLDSAIPHYWDIEGDVPLILIAEAADDPQPLVQALRDGARDLVERSQIERLQLIVTRELADLQVRQRLALAETQLELCEERAAELLGSTEEPIAFVREGVHIQANMAYQRRFGFASPEELDGLPLLDLVASEHQHAVRELLRRSDEGDSETQERVRLTCLHADGSLFPAVFSIASAELAGEACLRLLVQEADASSPDEDAALTDLDTGLPNRTAFVNALKQRLARTAQDAHGVVLLYVAINEFPAIIESVGLMRALEIAAGFGAALEQIVLTQGDSLLVRFADDGFMLLLENVAPEDAKQLAVTIRREMRLPLVLPRRDSARADCITGLALYDGTHASANQLIEAAYADAHGVGAASSAVQGVAAMPVSTAPESPTEAAATDAADRQIAEKIDEALQTGGLKLVYQPIISLLGDSQENYSVLVRLLDDMQRLHEAREIVGPAVRTGSIQAIDRWVIGASIKEVSEQRQRGQKINFFVNLAESTFLETTLLLWICDRLRDHDARGNWLTFQLQEVHARQHLAQLAKVTDGLKKIKSRIALSRFGHDEQPDSLLQALQVDFVLFAPDFAQGLSDDQSKQKHLMQLANLAREFNVKTVVTGVEDAATLTILWGAGIDYVQGNFLQRPSPVLTLEQD